MNLNGNVLCLHRQCVFIRTSFNCILGNCLLTLISILFCNKLVGPNRLDKIKTIINNLNLLF